MKKDNRNKYIIYYLIFYFMMTIAIIFLYERSSSLQKRKEGLSNSLDLIEDVINGGRAKYAFFITNDILCVIFSEGNNATLCIEKQDEFSYTIWYNESFIERISIANNIDEPYNTYDRNGDGIPDNISRGYGIDLNELYAIKYDKSGEKVLEKMPYKEPLQSSNIQK